MTSHQPGEAVFRSILPEDIDWKPFPAFPPSARLAVVVGEPTKPGPYVIRVRVNAIAPGWVRTERQLTKWFTAEGDKRRLEAQCLKRWVEPEDVARFCVFLASDDASACTAQHYVVDAGWV